MPFIDDHANGAGRGIILVFYLIDYISYFLCLIESTTNHTPIYPDCERTGTNSSELAAVYLAPKSTPPPPSKT